MKRIQRAMSLLHWSQFPGKSLLHPYWSSSSSKSHQFVMMTRYRLLSSTSDGATLHIRGLPILLSDRIAYPIFSSYGPLKELVLYENNNNNDTDTTEDETKNAIVTFVKRPSAYACYDELHWRPFTLMNPKIQYNPQHYNKPSKDRNLIKIEYETKHSQERIPKWIQHQRNLSQQRIPIYQKIYKLNQTMKQLQKNNNNDKDDEEIVQIKSQLSELDERLQETFHDD